MDEDHLDGNEKMASVIERNAGHKMKYLQRENAQLKQLLEDAENNVEINKNMIKVILQHNDGKSSNTNQTMES